MPSSKEPNYLETGEYFEDLIGEFFELDIEKHEDYENVWVYSITYPAYQGVEFIMRMMKFYSEKQSDLLDVES